MERDRLYKLMENTTLLDQSTLQELEREVKAYPYFHTVRLLYTKNLDQTNNEQYGNELGKSAVLCADRRKLFYLIYQENYCKFLEQPETNQPVHKDRTEALLDSFLTSLPESGMYDTSLADAGMNIVATDYLAYLDSLGEQHSGDDAVNHQLQHQDIIDAFIEKASSDTIFTPGDLPAPSASQHKENVAVRNEFLTETLARIYIKQKKYSQALTIIKRLSLTFPKKSVYFADQIRFLEYLIANERARKGGIE
jgi:hypothetical protein